MRKYTFTEKGHTFKRIDKKTARTVDRFTGEAPTPATLGTVEQYDYSYMQ